MIHIHIRSYPTKNNNKNINKSINPNSYQTLGFENHTNMCLNEINRYRKDRKKYMHKTPINN